MFFIQMLSCFGAVVSSFSPAQASDFKLSAARIRHSPWGAVGLESRAILWSKPMSRECKACGAQVTDQATTCPSCGAALATKMKLLPLAAFMLIVILIIQSYINKEEDGAPAVEPAAAAGSAEQ